MKTAIIIIITVFTTLFCVFSATADYCDLTQEEYEKRMEKNFSRGLELGYAQGKQEAMKITPKEQAGGEAMTQEQRQKTKEALSRYGQKNWVYGPCNWGWKRAIQLAEEYYREADPGLRGSILQLRYMERRRREEVMDKLNISYSTYQKAHDDLLSTIAVFAAHYGEL